MKKIGYLIGILISLAVIGGYLKYYLPLTQMGMGIGAPAEIGWVLAAIISILVTIYLIRNYLQKRMEPEKWLALFVGLRAVFFIAIALALPVFLWTKSLVASGICVSICWIFIFLSFMAMPGFTCYFWKPEWKKYYFGLMIAFGVIAISLLIKGFQPAIWIPEAATLFQGMPYVAGKWMYPIGKLLVMLPAGILFLTEGLAASGRARLRAIFWAIGFFWVATTIYIPGFVVGLWNPAVVGLYCVVAEICFAIGVALRPKEEKFVRKIE